MQGTRHDPDPHDWYSLTAEQVLARLDSVPAGLTSSDAAQRLAAHGVNELAAEQEQGAWSLLLAQFKNVLIIILLCATVLSGFLGHLIEAIAITVIVLFAVILGFVQEFRAGNALKALRRMAAPTARVLRDGQERELVARDLVPGDVVLLHMGDRIPADLRVLEAINLKTDEASLTGESVPVAKQVEALPEGDVPVAECSNLLFAGTHVSYGRGTAVVVATGMETEFGKISGLLQHVEADRTPLQQNLDKVGRILAAVALLIVAVIVLAGWMRGAPLLEMLIFGIALAVAVVPEALPAVVTISLAIGMQRMLKRNTLVSRLPTVETLGSTSVICSDKTGTLTRDEMTVREIWVAGQALQVSGKGYEPHGEFSRAGEPVVLKPVWDDLFRGAALAGDAELIQEAGEWEINGDPTEGALLVAAAKTGIDPGHLRRDFPRLDEVPFTSESKRMATLHRTPDGDAIVYMKGAAEQVLESCDRLLGPAGEVPLSDAQRREIRQVVEKMAARALRVLAVAFKLYGDLHQLDQGLVFAGLFGMIDPPRPEAAEAIQTCRKAGIRPIMITGDHPLTAEAIARELAIHAGGEVVTGGALARMSDAELFERVPAIQVYARVAPEDKLRVVEAWKQRGQVVAMTGDGVNDAPALKRADIGVAMGITGTDVSKQAAAMTLIDDNFASIVGAVEEGRAIFANIKKYLMYLLSSNIGEIGLLAGATLLGWPLPLTAVQILYVNLATDGLPALALAVDPQEDDLMDRLPRDPRRGIFTRPVVALMLIGGVWSSLVNLSLFRWALDSGRALDEAMTMVFVSLVLIQFLKAYGFRSDRHSVFRRPFANHWLNLAIAWECVLLLLIVYLPVLHLPFRTYALPLQDWLILLGAALTIIPVLEIGKWLLAGRVQEDAPDSQPLP